MSAEIERARKSINEYRKGYGQPQLPTDCIIQLMMGHHKAELEKITDDVITKGSEDTYGSFDKYFRVKGKYFDGFATGAKWVLNKLKQ